MTTIASWYNSPHGSVRQMESVSTWLRISCAIGTECWLDGWKHWAYAEAISTVETSAMSFLAYKHVTDPVELLFLSLMLRWEQSAPLDGTQGLLDGEPERNTQMSRMAYILTKVGAGSEDRYFQRLSAGAGWSKPGGKFLDKSKGHMKNPIRLSKGWWLDGCANVERKLEMLSDFRKLGFSNTFTNSACDFVAGSSVLGYVPTEEEQDEIIRNLRASDEDA